MSCILLLIALAGFLLRPVPIPPEKECLIVKGVVEQITEGDVKDIIFKLRDNNNLYYINRGLDYDFTLEGLRRDLIGKEVTIKYPDYWSLLADSSLRHLCKVQHNGKTVYSEID